MSHNDSIISMLNLKEKNIFFVSVPVSVPDT